MGSTRCWALRGMKSPSSRCRPDSPTHRRYCEGFGQYGPLCPSCAGYGGLRIGPHIGPYAARRRVETCRWSPACGAPERTRVRSCEPAPGNTRQPKVRRHPSRRNASSNPCNDGAAVSHSRSRCFDGRCNAGRLAHRPSTSVQDASRASLFAGRRAMKSHAPNIPGWSHLAIGRTLIMTRNIGPQAESLNQLNILTAHALGCFLGRDHIPCPKFSS